MQNKYEKAAETFVNAITEKDSLESLWRHFPLRYYMAINYNWAKLEDVENIRNGFTDSAFVFYKDKPEFSIDFTEDSVIIPIELKKVFPLVKIKINGKYYYFLLDTGCSRTLIGKNIATKNNVVYDNKEITVSAIDGTVTTFSGIFDEVVLEQMKISNFPVIVINRNDAIKSKFLFITLFHVDGIIGWDLLQKFDFTIDYKNKQLILRKPVIKDIERKNLFWYYVPIVKFYCNNYPLLFVLDTGSNLTSFNKSPISFILGIDTNNLKKRNRRVYGMNNIVKSQEYIYPDFQCYTLTDNETTFLYSSKILLQEIWRMEQIIPNNIDAILGSNWFRNKAIRVDALNGIFEILE